MEEEKGEGATAWEAPKILTETKNKTLPWPEASHWRWPAWEVAWLRRSMEGAVELSLRKG